MTPRQEKIYATLAGFGGLASLLGSRVYPDIAPQGVARPFVVWQEIYTDPMNNLGGSVEVNGLANLLIQVSSWATSATLARDVDLQARLAMIAGTQFKSLLRDSPSLGFEDDVKLFGIQSDFSVWLKS